MYKYIIYYGGEWLRDSSEIDLTYQSEDEAKCEAKVDVESYMNDWEIEGIEYDKDLFEIEIEEV